VEHLRAAEPSYVPRDSSDFRRVLDTPIVPALGPLAELNTATF